MTKHNHFSRDIKRYGICPRCDESWDRWAKDEEELQQTREKE